MKPSEWLWDTVSARPPVILTHVSVKVKSTPGFTWFGLQEEHSKTHPPFDVERHLMESCEESSSSSMQRTCGSVPHRRQTAGWCYTGTMGSWETNGLGCNSARHLRSLTSTTLPFKQEQLQTAQSSPRRPNTQTSPTPTLR